MADENGAGTEAPARTRNPVYDVFELRTLYEVTRSIEEGSGREVAEVTGEVAAWVILANDVAAGSDKQAIAKAADAAYAESDPRRYGQFWAPLAGTFKPRCRDRQMQPVEVWS